MVRTRPKGFTLVELLIVIALIGLLALLGYVALNQGRVKARDAKRISDLRQLQSGLEIYYIDNNSYPHTGEDGDALGLIAYLTPPVPPTQNDGDCGGEDAQVLDRYPYASYFTSEERGNNLPFGTKGITERQGMVCTEDDEAACTAYVMSSCLGGALQGLEAGVIRATEQGISN